MEGKGENPLKKSLVVDDEFTSRVILQKFLSGHGEVLVCKNGQEAIEAFTSALESGDPFSLVCMDVMMPGMTGIEALQKIREIEASRGIPREDGVKVLMTTGLDAFDSELTQVRDLYENTMTKPFRMNAVVSTLASLGF
jgi:two-component system, chemotaxis family, chemotaxis protein CheY